LQLIRYVPLVKQQGGRAILAVQKGLIPLLKDSGYGELMPRNEPWPRYDAQLGMFSLPWTFHSTPETVPAVVPYLKANADLVAQWRDPLAQRGGFRVGICWQGNPAFHFDRTRSIPLAEFAPLAQVSGVLLFS